MRYIRDISVWNVTSTVRAGRKGLLLKEQEAKRKPRSLVETSCHWHQGRKCLSSGGSALAPGTGAAALPTSSGAPSETCR